MSSCHHPDAGTVAKAYHDAFEQVAPTLGLPPIQPWEQWDPQMRELATAIMDRLLSTGVIRYTPPTNPAAMKRWSTHVLTDTVEPKDDIL